jgi:SAM-dependent methyltransferase
MVQVDPDDAGSVLGRGVSSASVSPVGEWEPEAENWVLWARTPGHDAYWYYRESFFDHIVPPPGRRCLEIGCGEGRVARDLAARGHRVIGIDSSRTLVGYSRREHADSTYLQSDGAALPFRDEVFDLVVAYNSLQVVTDMSGTVRQAARVLTRGGRFCFCVIHPLSGVGRFADESLEAPFVVRGDYFANNRVEDTVERDGLEMTFRGWIYSLQDYAEALEAASLRIEAMREPRPSGDAPGYRRWNRIPMFLLVRAVKARPAAY